MYKYKDLSSLLKHLIPSIFAAAISISCSPVLLADGIQPEVKTLRVNNYDMSYVESGKGAPLVLVHGALNDYRNWLPLLKEFGDSNRTIAVSLRHYYPERWDGKGSDLSLQQHADDLVAFIRALDTGPGAWTAT